MIKIHNKENCCGCTACKEVCPKDCITMDTDVEGFAYPVVDMNRCINCNLCNKVCPIINKDKNRNSITAYAAYVDNDGIRLKSSSGGLFTIFADYILDIGGVVAGAAFNDEFLVEHIVIKSKEELSKLQGSKYLQSNMNHCYSKVKKYLDNDTKVLFTGTACQIAGLKKYLRKEYNILYTIDVLCHGVPSPKVWKKYLNEKEFEYHSKLQQIFFRQKDFGWKRYALSLKYKDKAYLMDHHNDTFMKLFLNEICLRPSCHDCRFKDFPRSSDLTIGDAWGIQNIMPEMDDDKGTSVLVANSPKGDALLTQVIDKLVIKQTQLDIILPITADSRKSVKPHGKRTQFFNDLDKKSTDELVKLTNTPLSKKVFKKFKYYVKRFLRLFVK